VTLKGLSKPTLLSSSLSKNSTNIDNFAKDYLLGVAEKLQPLPAEFSLNKELIW